MNIEDVMNAKKYIKSLTLEERNNILEELIIAYFGKKPSESMRLLTKGDVEGYRKHYKNMHDQGSKLTKESLEKFLDITK